MLALGRYLSVEDNRIMNRYHILALNVSDKQKKYEVVLEGSESAQIEIGGIEQPHTSSGFAT